MEQQTILVKGMVCRRCVLAVETQLRETGHTPLSVSLGEVSFISNETQDSATLEKRLSLLGFSLLRDKKAQTVAAAKALVEEVYSGAFDFAEGFRFSRFAARRLQMDYGAISEAFIALEKKTLEQHLIAFRLDKVKELLVYSSLTLADIAFRLNFSSTAHLSTQFKQQTGLNPSFFKSLQQQKIQQPLPAKN